GSSAVTPVFVKKGDDLFLDIKEADVPEAPVSPVGLTVDSVSNSSDSCNLTVTCRTQDSHISSTFTCDTQTCSQEGGERSEVTTSGASLHVYLVNDSIICNHSNQVSRTEHMTNIQDFCPQHADPLKPNNHVMISVVVPVVGVLTLMILIICAVFFKLRRRGNRSSAVTPVVVKKGDDLFLNLTGVDVPEDFSSVSWALNNKTLVTFFKPNVWGRVETSVENFSVKLKNLQEADSGVYTVCLMAEKEQTLAEYNVIVQAPVSPVGLTVDSVSNSSDSCSLTVTCRTQDSHISSTFTCDTQTCSQEGGERSEVTTSGASLHVYLVNGSIICNHSNQVSRTENMTNIQDFCPQHAGFPQSGSYVNTAIVVVVVVVPVGIILISAGICYYLKKKRSSAVTPVFVKKGDDLLLNVTEADVPEDFSTVSWALNNKTVLVTFSQQSRPKVSNSYIGRVETSVNKFSVKLKNLQEADSGLYTVCLMAEKEQTLAEYNVTVQGFPQSGNDVTTAIVVVVVVVPVGIILISAGICYYLKKKIFGRMQLLNLSDLQLTLRGVRRRRRKKKKRARKREKRRDVCGNGASFVFGSSCKFYIPLSTASHMHTSTPNVFKYNMESFSLHSSSSSRRSPRHRAERQLMLLSRAAVWESRQAQQLDEGRADWLGSFLVS
ncbi:hypothetical protein GBF38_016015, partial [Nibea albiflora]